jgi:hypothetical protein
MKPHLHPPSVLVLDDKYAVFISGRGFYMPFYDTTYCAADNLSLWTDPTHFVGYKITSIHNAFNDEGLLVTDWGGKIRPDNRRPILPGMTLHNLGYKFKAIRF